MGLRKPPLILFPLKSTKFSTLILSILNLVRVDLRLYEYYSVVPVLNLVPVLPKFS